MHLLCSCDGPFSGRYISVVDDCYTTMSALGNKGEKNQSKYKAIDINNLFKGSSVTPQKAAPGDSYAEMYASFWQSVCAIVIALMFKGV